MQASTGFGFALLAAPVLVAVLGPARAVTTLLALGTFLAVLMLPRRANRHVALSHARPLLIWAAPGVPVGALLLAHLPEDALALFVSGAVLAALAAMRAPAAVPAPRWSAPAAGFAAGALTASTSINGPPLVLHLLRARLGPVDSRAALAVCFLVLDVGGMAALVLGGLFAVPASLPLLLIGALAGQRAGALVTKDVDPARWTAAVRALLAISALALAAGAAL